MKPTIFFLNVHGQRESFALGTQSNLYSTESRWVCIGGNTNFRFGIGGNANFSIFTYQHVCIPNTKIVALGVSANVRTQCEWFCVAVEYRLYMYSGFI